jgi:two-component system chemotaxis response regulator CheB
VIRVLVIDDSALVRKMLTDELGKFDDIQVVGGAVDPYVARDKILALKPDVLTLDLEMPRMDGLTFLAKLMKHHPLPVIVVSSVAPENSRNTVKALALGAFEVIQKPGSALSTPDIARQLVRSIRAAASAKIQPLALPSAGAPPPAPTPIRGSDSPLTTTHKVVALGASTGGTQAIEALIRVLPADFPGMVVVQHMPAQFTEAFAQRLDTLGALRVLEAREGDQVLPGRVLIAPGGIHMELSRSGAFYSTHLLRGEPVHHQIPAVDILFDSVARQAGGNAIGVLLTGMGADGARGLLTMREAGAWTLAQDEASSVVWGMPGEAVRMGAACEMASLQDMPRAMAAALRRSEPAPPPGPPKTRP